MKTPKIRKKFSFFTLAVILLSLILIYRCTVCFQELHHSLSIGSHYSSQDYEYALQYKQYSYLNTLTRRDTSTASDDFVRACRSISDYYEAAILYHAYDAAKNNAAASKELQRMKDCETAWPDYEEYFRDIDQLFASNGLQ